jgi:hypothetical protein
MREGMARDGDRELTEIEVVREPEDLERPEVIDHAPFVIQTAPAGAI